MPSGSDTAPTQPETSEDGWTDAADELDLDSLEAELAKLDASQNDKVLSECGADTDNWISHLDAALECDSCDFTTVRSISQGRPLHGQQRARAWLVLLGCANKRDQFADWNSVFDRPDQDEIHDRCIEAVSRISHDAHDPESLSVQSDLESVLTLHCQQREVPFQQHQVDVLLTLLGLGLPRDQLYNAFYAVMTKYVPRCDGDGGRAFDLFRLLLLYHEPSVCSFLDTRKVTPDMYASEWFRCLLSRSCDLPVTLAMWDVYLQQADPFMIFFLALVILINAREYILELANEPPSVIAERIATFPTQLEQDDIADFCQLALFYSNRTPQSFRRDYHGPIFGSNLAATSFENIQVHSLLCLPVSVPELLQAQTRVSDDVQYLVVDARPHEHFQAGHLPGAYNLDASMLVKAPDQYSLSLQSMLIFKAKTHPNDHLCFMGSGRETEDQYVHMAVAAILQRHTPFISLARGGYSALHDVLRESLSTRLKSHNVAQCIQCNPQLGAARSDDSGFFDSMQSITDRVVPSLMNRVSTPLGAVKSRTSRLRDRMAGVMGRGPAAQTEEVENIRHIDARQKKKGKPYKPDSVHKFNEQGDDVFGVFTESSDENDAGASVSTSAKPTERVSLRVIKEEALASFECKELAESKEWASILYVTPKQLVLLRVDPLDPGLGIVHHRRGLGEIIKITSKRTYPELLSFRYGKLIEKDKPPFVTAMDKLLFPPSIAGDAAKCVKRAILEQNPINEEAANVGMGSGGSSSPDKSADTRQIKLSSTTSGDGLDLENFEI